MSHPNAPGPSHPVALRGDDPRVVAYVQQGFYSNNTARVLIVVGLLVFFAIAAGVAAPIMPHRMGAIPVGVYGLFVWVMALVLLRGPTLADAQGVKAALGRKHLWSDCLGARVNSKQVRTRVGERKRGGTSTGVYRSDVVFWAELDFKGGRGLERGGPEAWCKALVEYATVASAPARPGGLEEALANPAIVQRILHGREVSGRRPLLGGLLPGLLALGFGTLVVLGALAEYAHRHGWLRHGDGGPAWGTSSGLPSGAPRPATSPRPATTPRPARVDPPGPPPGLANLTRATIRAAVVPLGLWVAHAQDNGSVFREHVRVSGTPGTHHILLFAPDPAAPHLVEDGRIIALTRPSPEWDGAPLLSALTAQPITSTHALERAVRHAGLRVERSGTVTTTPETGLVAYSVSASQASVDRQIHVRMFDWSASLRDHGARATHDADRAVVVVPESPPGAAEAILSALTGPR